MSFNSRDQFLYPQYLLQIGGYSFTEGISLDWYSSKQKLFEIMEIRFTHRLHQVFSFAPMDKVTFSWGYAQGMQKIFSGFVDRTYQSGNVVIAKDYMLKLREGTIKEIFMDVTQDDLLTGILSQAGVGNFQIKSSTPVKKAKVNLHELTYDMAIDRANALWGTKELYYFDANETFYFGLPKAPRNVPPFHFGENILNLSKHEGTYEMEIIATYVDFTNQITVNHPNCSGIFEVEEVRFHVTNRGFPKMFLYFKER
ncbi:MAG: hypothetical protein Q4A78_07435 [Peptostreptococcaceae bacterium]|nr:hypothetical protein [Peptostreptococcaceae bacterium]